jgi:hypothetical protein
MFTEHFGLKSSGEIGFLGLYACGYNDKFKRSNLNSVGRKIVHLPAYAGVIFTGPGVVVSGQMHPNGRYLI